MKSITEQDLFKYLQENLSVSLSVSEELVGGVGGHTENQATIILTLVNPEGKEVTISKCSDTISADY